METASADPTRVVGKFIAVVLGNAGVGKTSLIHRYINGDSLLKPMPTVASSSSTSKEEDVNGKLYKLEIRDTAGQEVYRSLAPNYIRGSDCVIYVCDATDINSVRDLDKWEEQVNNSGTIPGIKFIVVNKIDKVRGATNKDAPTPTEPAAPTESELPADQADGNVEQAENQEQSAENVETPALSNGNNTSEEVFNAAAEWGTSHGAAEFQTSAMTGHGVKELFTTIFEQLSTLEKTNMMTGINLKNDAKSTQNAKKCCA